MNLILFLYFCFSDRISALDNLHVSRLALGISHSLVLHRGGEIYSWGTTAVGSSGGLQLMMMNGGGFPSECPCISSCVYKLLSPAFNTLLFAMFVHLPCPWFYNPGNNFRSTILFHFVFCPPYFFSLLCIREGVLKPECEVQGKQDQTVKISYEICRQ